MKDIILFEEVKELIAIMLFGSKARSDSDIYSDTDIFILIEDNLNQTRKQKIINTVKLAINLNDVNVSIYTSKIFRKMAEDGSMFLWHLKIEGKYLYKKNNIDIFNSLKDFNRYKKNYTLYNELFIDAKESILKNGINAYDLSMLFFVSRNVSLLTCFKLNNPKFGRYSVYQGVINHLNFEPLKWEYYTFLAEWRLDYTRGINKDLEYPSDNNMKEIFNGIESLLNLSKHILFGE